MLYHEASPVLVLYPIAERQSACVGRRSGAGAGLRESRRLSNCCGARRGHRGRRSRPRSRCGGHRHRVRSARVGGRGCLRRGLCNRGLAHGRRGGGDAAWLSTDSSTTRDCTHALTCRG